MKLYWRWWWWRRRYWWWWSVCMCALEDDATSRIISSYSRTNDHVFRASSRTHHQNHHRHHYSSWISIQVVALAAEQNKRWRWWCVFCESAVRIHMSVSAGRSVGSKSNNNLHWKPCDRPCQTRHTRFDTMSNVGQENTSHRVFHPIFTPNSKYNRSQALITLSLAARVSWTDLFRRIGWRLVVVGWVEEQLMLIRRRVILNILFFPSAITFDLCCCLQSKTALPVRWCCCSAQGGTVVPRHRRLQSWTFLFWWIRVVSNP